MATTGDVSTVLTRQERLALLTAAVVLWVTTGEGVLFLVAAGAVWRLFTSDRPTERSSGIALYFVGVMAGLAGLMWLLPGAGAGLP